MVSGQLAKASEPSSQIDSVQLLADASLILWFQLSGIMLDQ
jgi:hypothetical protein